MIDRLWASNDLPGFFTHHQKVVCPWPRAGRNRDTTDVRVQLTNGMLRHPVHLSQVDPRTLHASQAWVVREHAEYYGTGAWERTGITSADRDLVANRYPVIVRDGRSRLLIASGHHRALVALLEGRPLLCRLFPSEPDTAIALLPHLLVGPSSRIGHVPADRVADAVAHVRAGRAVLCRELPVAQSAVLILASDAGEPGPSIDAAPSDEETS